MPKFTDISHLPIEPNMDEGLSNFAKFFFTFQGFEFLDQQTNTIKTLLQMYWRDPVSALLMAKTLKIPSRYKVIQKHTSIN